ncbi:hypothetical protein BDV96DRAFT_495527 [Lophiotrema nucula]|uniref:Fungal-specific transcription factor domain-containing protein n=1 Tax=Lophiotrema nucula TaxID=690887 RepID=A0A6A5Z3R6_9PLEO|nr:hypothetical protein BDV96DRAFT_495527 [Lophiotrema nucula]
MSQSPAPSSSKKTNYRVRFRHTVCVATGAQVTRADIKKYDYFFEKGQRWVKTTGDVDFVDESSQMIEDAESEGVSGASEGSRRQGQRLAYRPRNAYQMRRTKRTTENTSRHPSRNPTRNPSPEVPNTAAPAPAFRSVTEDLTPNYQTPSPRRSCMNFGRRCTNVGQLGVLPHGVDFNLSLETTEAPTEWPLADPVEAQLYRYFVEKVASWWDTTSSEDVWRETVPKLALANPMLLNAIFLLAAQHLRGTDPLFPAEPFQYHERLLNILIPHIADRGYIDDDATLAAAIILRCFEDFVAGTAGQSNLSTFELFTTVGGSLLNTQSAVVRSCFLRHIRFEVYSSLLGQQSLRVNYRTFILPDLVEPSDNIAWNNRIVWLAARVLQWSTGDSQTLHEWQELTDLIDDWEKSRPSSFAPFFYRERNLNEGRYYPDLWFSTSYYIEANQYLVLARIALAKHNPLLQEAGTQTMSDYISTKLREVVAMAQCNDHRTPALFLASHVLYAYGPMVEDHFDRVKIIEFLEEVDTVGWATKPAMRWLASQWGWSIEES